MTMYEQARHCSFGLTKTLVCNGLVNKGAVLGWGRVACLFLQLFVSPMFLSVLCLFAKPCWLGLMGNAGVCCAFTLLSHIFHAMCFCAVALSSFYGCGLSECVCWLAALELRSTIKVHVLFCEQFYGHVVNGVHLHFKYDGLEQCFNAGITLHVGVLGYKKRDAALS